MDLTARERQWALGVKEAVRLSEDIDSALVSDFDVACHALIGRGDETQALERIKGMETFRRTYGIDDSVEQGSRYMQEFVRMQPGALLKLESCPITQEGVVIWDAAAFCSSLPLTPSTRDVARGPWNWEVHVVTAYYMLRALHSCFDSVREGVFLICEAMGQVPAFRWSVKRASIMNWASVSPTKSSRSCATTQGVSLLFTGVY